MNKIRDDYMYLVHFIAILCSYSFLISSKILILLLITSKPSLLIPVESLISNQNGRQGFCLDIRRFEKYKRHFSVKY